MLRIASVWLLALPARASDIDVSFADTGYTSVFSEQYSYDQHTTSGHAKHFDVGEHGGRSSLRVRIYHDDKALSSGSTTCPRSELSQKDKANGLKTEIDYVAEWDWQLQQFTVGYQFAFMQIFGRNGPNIFLRYVRPDGRRDRYQLMCEKCHCSLDDQCAHHSNDQLFVDLPGDASDDMNKWITWKVEFRLSSGSAGYLRIYRDGQQLHAYKGPTSDGSNHHFKLGLYTQHKPCQVKDTTSLLSHLKIS